MYMNYINDYGHERKETTKKKKNRKGQEYLFGKKQKDVQDTFGYIRWSHINGHVTYSGDVKWVRVTVIYASHEERCVWRSRAEIIASHERALFTTPGT